MATLPRKPRLWTEEQVEFLLQEIRTGKPHKEIADLFNEKYDGVGQIKHDQIKYIKAQYRNRLQDDETTATNSSKVPAKRSRTSTEEDSRPHKVQKVNAPPVTRATRSQTLAQQNLASKNNNDNYNMSFQPLPAGDKQDAPAAPIAAMGVSNAINANSAANEIREYPPLSWPLVENDDGFVGPLSSKTVQNWNDGPHEGCPFDAPHQHCADGGIYFPSVDAIQQMVLKMKGPSIPLQAMAAEIEKYQEKAREKAGTI